MKELDLNTKETPEIELWRFPGRHSTLKKDGIDGFLVPGVSGGVFLCILGSALAMTSLVHRLITSSLIFFGMMLISSAMVIFAIFERKAREATSCILIVTNKRVRYLRGSDTLDIPLCEIGGAYTKKSGAFARFFIDMKSLEARELTLIWKDSSICLPLIKDTETAAKKISSLLCSVDNPTCL